MKPLNQVSDLIAGDRLVNASGESYIVVDVTCGRATITRTHVISEPAGWQIADSWVECHRVNADLKRKIAELESTK